MSDARSMTDYTSHSIRSARQYASMPTYNPQQARLATLDNGLQWMSADWGASVRKNMCGEIGPAFAGYSYTLYKK